MREAGGGGFLLLAPASASAPASTPASAPPPSPRAAPASVAPSAMVLFAVEGLCARLSAMFNGGKLLNASEVFAFERGVVNAETRAGMHKAAG